MIHDHRAGARVASFRPIAAALLLAASVCTHAASYVYDDNGRLRAVTDSSGASGYYRYDKLGNLLGVSSIAAGQLQVFSFTPNHGAVGSTVTITGQGFDPAAANDTVQFNGLAAAVSSASATQLVVTVPGGATTGAVSVAVASALTTSDDVFSVTTDTGQAPTIAAFSPAIVLPNARVSVQGAHFVASSGGTQAGVGSSTATVSPGSDTQLGFVVAPGARSGPVLVSTAYGTGQSAQTLVVIPTASGLATGNFSGSVNLPFNTSTRIAVTPGKYLVAPINLTAGQWVTLQVDNFAVSSALMRFYDPDGRDLYSTSGYVNVGGAMSIHLAQALQTGAYLAMFYSDASGSFTVTPQVDPIAGSQPITLSANGGTQSGRLIVPGTVGQAWGLKVTALTVTPSANVNASISDPNPTYGGGWGPMALRLTSGQATNLPMLPHTEQYPVTVSAPQGTSFSTTVTPLIEPVSTLTVNGPAVAQTTTVPSEYGYYTFNASAGQTVTLHLSNTSNPSGSSSIVANVTWPDGGGHTNPMSAAPGSAANLTLSNLSLSGTYTIQMYPTTPATLGYTMSVTSP